MWPETPLFTECSALSCCHGE